MRLTRRVAVAVALLVVLTGVVQDSNLIYINNTISMPRGVWWAKSRTSVVVGDVVALRPPELAFELGCVRRHQVLIKQVVGMEGDRVCISAEGLIESTRLRQVLETRRVRDVELAWTGCRVLEAGEYFVAGAHERSCDSRWFGPLRVDSIIEPITGLYLLDSPDGLDERIKQGGEQ